MDGHADSVSYDKIMSDMVGESSKSENESEHIVIIHQRFSDDDSQIVESTQQEVINTTEYSELPGHMKDERFSEDGSQVDESTQQEVINTNEFQAMTLDFNMVHKNIINTETDSKSLNEWTNKDMNDKVQPLIDNATSTARDDNFCVVDDILTIFPFVCGICDEKFKCISIYFKHISIHEKMNSYLHHCCRQDDIGEKITLFTCGICSLKFPTLCTLYKHLMESESVHDFVFKSGERTVYAYNDDLSENTVVAKNVAHTYRTRKRASHHLSHNTDVETLTKKAIVKFSPSKLNGGSSHVSGNKLDSKDSENVIERAINVGKKSKSCKKNTKRNLRTCDKSKKEDSHKELDANGVPSTGKKRAKSIKLIRGNSHTKTKRTTSLRSRKTPVSSNFVEVDNIEDEVDVKNVGNDIEDDVEVKEDDDDDIEDDFEVIDVDDNIEHDVEVKEDAVVYNIEDDVEEKEDHKTVVVGDDDDDDDDDDDADDKITCKPKVTKQSRKKGVNRKDMKFPCEVCGAVFKLQYLKRHKRTHDEPSLPCDQCDNVFKCKFKLNYHIKQVHTEEMRYTCDVCGKSFKAWPYLKQHRKIHVKERTFQCQDCPMKFKTVAVLRAHLKTHSDQKPYCCEVCGLKFKRAGLLTTHKKYHSEEKPFACPECGKTFKVNHDMKKHYRVHLPPKFFCSICGKSFVQKYNMRIHMKIHGVKL